MSPDIEWQPLLEKIEVSKDSIRNVGKDIKRNIINRIGEEW